MTQSVWDEQCPCCEARTNGSDHCPECGCEEFETSCDQQVEGAWKRESARRNGDTQ